MFTVRSEIFYHHFDGIVVLEIPRKGYDNFLCVIDKEDLSKVHGKRLRITFEGGRKYKKTPYVTIREREGEKEKKLHRYLMGDLPYDGKRLIDHIFGDTLDNRKSQLRFCTHAESARNISKSKHIKTSSIYKGVCFFKRDKVWTAQVSVGNKSVYVGRYETEVEAAIAYNEAAIKYFGEFARLNVIAA